MELHNVIGKEINNMETFLTVVTLILISWLTLLIIFLLEVWIGLKHLRKEMMLKNKKFKEFRSLNKREIQKGQEELEQKRNRFKEKNKYWE